MKIKCKRCGKIMMGNDELSAERMFDQHVCKGMRDLSEMPTDILYKVATKEISEEDGWKLVDKRNNA